MVLAALPNRRETQTDTGHDATPGGGRYNCRVGNVYSWRRFVFGDLPWRIVGTKIKLSPLGGLGEQGNPSPYLVATPTTVYNLGLEMGLGWNSLTGSTSSAWHG
jgi:hypothetical protein